MVSVFDIFKIGIGPSSSHTVGPMKAANSFVSFLTEQPWFEEVDQIICHLYGLLAYTGLGHATDKAVILGISGERPDTVSVDEIDKKLDDIVLMEQILLDGKKVILFKPEEAIVFHKGKGLPHHSNGMVFCALKKGEVIIEKTYYSVGGGFIRVNFKRNQKFRIHLHLLGNYFSIVKKTIRPLHLWCV